MPPFIALTDNRWFDFLSIQAKGGAVDEVNFWQPKATRPMKSMESGEPVFFRLKRPDYAVAGYGFFAHFQVVPVEDAWDLFGWKNGDGSRMGFLQRIGGYRGEDLSILGRPSSWRPPSSRGLSTGAFDLVVDHHEHPDGKGFPVPHESADGPSAAGSDSAYTSSAPLWRRLATP